MNRRLSKLYSMLMAIAIKGKKKKKAGNRDEGGTRPGAVASRPVRSNRIEA